jgi:hypothetical protein
MGEKLVVGPILKGLKTDRTAFNIDNDSFPVLQNAYQWRGRIKRKRGTTYLTQLTRNFSSTTINLVAGATNLITAFSLEANSSIQPGSVTITDATSGNVYTDLNEDGTLQGTPAGSGTINYASGAITIVGGGADVISAVFNYYPMLPVMGLEDFTVISSQFPNTIAFDTTYSYNINTTSPFLSYDISFYKNPSTGTYTNYVAKSTQTPTTWNGANYQQFWTTNYEGALWATNGVSVPFSANNVAMQFKPIVTVTNITPGPPASAKLNITGHGLVVGDFLFINEVLTTTGINFQTGYVTTVNDANNVTVTFPNATINTNGTGGIAQYLTNRSDTTKDCLRWFDGDPTVNSGINGWVNFAPPLCQKTFSIAERGLKQWYLVGAKSVLPFKDRLLFFGPVIQNSSAGSQVYLQDTVIYSQNGTPYYTASFTNTPTSTIDTPTSSTNVFFPILTPTGQVASAPAWFEDQTGFGGFISAGVNQALNTVGPNQDVIICGFDNLQADLVYTSNDLVPFNFYIVNSELGSSSTFSTVIMDKGILTRGNRGFVITSQTNAERFDLEIPDIVFESGLNNNGLERITAQRDYINEWIYFTYLNNQSSYVFPNQKLLFNYRDNTWGVFYENYTTYGQFKRTSGLTWGTLPYGNWTEWNDPWSAGDSTLFQPDVIAGNQQGFVLIRENDSTNEGNSLGIQNIVGNLFTSPNHCLNDNDYVILNGILGTLGAILNGNIFTISNTTTNTFQINYTGSGTYLGSGYIQRIYIPFIQTKQFPVAWSMSRKVRLGPQAYLFATTPNGQITLNIYLSQDGANPYNEGNIVPQNNVKNNSLIYSTLLFTSPELTINPANNISIGNVGNGILTTITLSLLSLLGITQNTLVAGSVVITIGAVATFTDNGSGGFTVTGTGVSSGSSINYTTGTTVLVFSVAPTATPSTVTLQYYYSNIQTPTAVTQEYLWHRMNTSLIGDTVQIGFTLNDSQLRDTTLSNQFAEISFHGMVLDVTPSQVLV